MLQKKEKKPLSSEAQFTSIFVYILTLSVTNLRFYRPYCFVLLTDGHMNNDMLHKIRSFQGAFVDAVGKGIRLVV